jgi:Tol biopolymer transport system component
MRRTYLYVIAVVIIAIVALVVFVFAPKPMNTGAAVPRKAGQISFLSERDIYLLDTDTGAITRLTQGASVDRMYWSPDGEYLLFDSRDETKDRAPRDLYLLRVGSGELKRLTSSGRGDFAIWSPDGKSIAYYGYGNEIDGRALYIIDVTSAQPHKLVDEVSQANWSPDGKQIAFFAYDTSDPATRKEFISVINADGTDLRRFGEGVRPVWSPNGKQIAYTDYSHKDTRLMVMNADGSNLRTLTTYQEVGPVGEWSPDGKYLWFVRYTPEHEGSDRKMPNLHIIDVNGNNLVDLQQINPAHLVIVPGAEYPHWSPDGKRLLFTRSVGRICGFSVDTAAPECWVSGDAGRWSPDGKQIAFDGYDRTKDDSAKHARQICIYTLHTKTDWLKCYGRDLRDDTYPQWRP